MKIFKKKSIIERLTKLCLKSKLPPIDIHQPIREEPKLKLSYADSEDLIYYLFAVVLGIRLHIEFFTEKQYEKWNSFRGRQLMWFCEGKTRIE